MSCIFLLILKNDTIKSYLYINSPGLFTCHHYKFFSLQSVHTFGKPDILLKLNISFEIHFLIGWKCTYSRYGWGHLFTVKVQARNINHPYLTVSLENFTYYVFTGLLPGIIEMSKPTSRKVLKKNLTLKTIALLMHLKISTGILIKLLLIQYKIQSIRVN